MILKVLLIVALSVVALFIVLLVYSCCVIAGNSDERSEELLKPHKTSDLSDLENQTLERLLQAFEEDGVNLVINDGRVVNYEIEECE